MKVRTQILVGYIIVCVCICIVSAISSWGFYSVNRGYDGIVNQSTAIIINLREIQFYFTGQANDERGFLLTQGKEFRQEIMVKSAEVKKRIDLTKPLLQDQQDTAILDKITKAHEQFTQINLSVIDTYTAGNTEAAKQLSFGAGRSMRKELETSFNELVSLSQKKLEAEKSAIQANSTSIGRINIGLAIVSFVFALIIGVDTANRITKPINQVIALSEQMAEGNLNIKTEGIKASGEIARLLAQFSNMANRLKTMIIDIKENAEQVASSSQQLYASAEECAKSVNEIATAATAVAQGTEQQMDSVRDTSQEIDKVAAHVFLILEKAASVTKTSGRASSTIQEGNRAVEQTVGQMSTIESAVSNSAALVSRLGERSQEIGQIVEAIAGIAGQTNLLALNAAIEAARAGEQGRGFAVVAEEVRKLAEQSHSAASQIASLIGEVQADTACAVAAMEKGTQEAKAGTEVVRATGQAFVAVAALVTEMATQADEIHLAIEQIAAGSRQITSAMNETGTICKETAGQTQTVSAAAEQQSATMEEIASSSQALAAIAERMHVATARFAV